MATKAGTSTEQPTQQTVKGDPLAAPPETRLQEVLPEISRLAQRVGGLKHLEEIIRDLRAKET